MPEPLPEIQIPDRPAFKPADVCELLKLQPYVLRSWENEFKDLGVSKTPGGPRIYRRADLERAIRIRHLVFAEGLTLAGVRRRFEQERPPEPEAGVEELEVPGAMAASALDAHARSRVREARLQLRSLLERLKAERPRVVLSPRGPGSDGLPEASGRADEDPRTRETRSEAGFELAAPGAARANGDAPAARRPRPPRRRKTAGPGPDPSAPELPVEPSET